jgi:membrane-bound serine protease (ClpP class)
MYSRSFLLALCLLASAGLTAQESNSPPYGAVWVLELDGAVGPATSDYLLRGFESAAEAGAELIVIRISTPGGLDTSMRDIIKGILSSPVPVASYVSPHGARAASAGTYILYASHIAAMAPATNLGAATPVSIGGPGPPALPDETPADDTSKDQAGSAMEKKMVNDASAYIRGLATLRGRNGEWAELAVREAASLSAEEALEQNVIGYIAKSLDDLLEQLDQTEIEMIEETITLDLANAPIHRATPDWRTEFLATITNPNLVLILGMIGFYGIILEFYNPGSLVPGTIGIICLILAGYALQLLPVNYAGLALLVLGMALMLAEALSPSFGILGIGGVISFVIGGIILFDSDIDAFRVAWPVLAAVALMTAGFIVITASIALRMRKRAASTGAQQLLGAQAVALADFAGEGQVQLGGEIWAAHCDQSLQRGDPVIVKDVTGLMLSVEKGES